MAMTHLRPQDLNEIFSDAEMKEMDDERKRKERQEREQRELHEAFMAEAIAPDAVERLNKVVRIAAEQGLKEVQVITFPASFCKRWRPAHQQHAPGLAGLARRLR